MEGLEVKLLEQMAKNNIRQIKELHIKSGVSRTIISDLLNDNKRSVRLDTVEKICRALNCEVGELIVLKK